MEDRVEEDEQRLGGNLDQGTGVFGTLEPVEVATISRLVLLDYQEFFLRVGPAQVDFDNWSQNTKLVRVRIELINFCSDQRASSSSLLSRPKSSCHSRESGVILPLIITPPFTKRFRCGAVRSFARNPFMIALSPNEPTALEYHVEFSRPQATDSDFVWDNFQDQLVFQTRLEKFSLLIKAAKFGRVAEQKDSSFYPHSLCDVKAPALKLFDLIEKQFKEDTMRAGTPSGLSRREILQPLPVKLKPPLDTERKKTPIKLDPLDNRRSMAPTVCANQHQINSAEAQAVVLRMRARFKAQQQHDKDAKIPVSEPTPECKTEENCAELEEFNQLVEHAKQQVAQKVSDAHTELAYYRAVAPGSRPTEKESESLASTTNSDTKNNQMETTGSSPRADCKPSIRRTASSSKRVIEPIPPSPVSSVNVEDPVAACRPPPRIRSSSKSKPAQPSSMASKRRPQRAKVQRDEVSSSEEDNETDAPPPVYVEACGGMNELDLEDQEEFMAHVQ